MSSSADLATALQELTGFLESTSLTSMTAELEHEIAGCTRDDLAPLLVERRITPRLLTAALRVREDFGRLNDVIHATAIVLALSSLLEPGETLKRPSLAAGNDPSRPFDVETDQRIAEFKFARWDGHDAMRKRQVFKDLVHLAADDSGRSAELYVLGERPLRFLRTTKSAASWALDRSPTTASVFEERFGSLAMPIPEFVEGPAKHVQLINLEERLPGLFATQQ